VGREKREWGKKAGEGDRKERREREGRAAGDRTPTWSFQNLLAAEADLTVGHSCSGRRGPWPWRPPGVGPARRTMEVALS